VLKVSEVYEKQVKTYKEHSNGSEVVSLEKVYDTRECLISREYVVSIRPYEFSTSQDNRKLAGRFPADTKFSAVVMDGNSFRASEIVVVGSFESFCRRLQENKP
jgi:hypothetical protein